MTYKLFWKGEEIDSTNSEKEAHFLLSEYNMAYGGGVSIKESKQ